MSSSLAARTARGAYVTWGCRALDCTVILLGGLPALAVGLVVLAINAVAFRGLRRAFFVQERVGKHGRPFRMVKFRTMKPIAHAMRLWKDGEGAQRVTLFGRFLRCTHLDELPQLINVLRGEMRLVGPRPEMCEIVAWARAEVPGFDDQLAVPPGLTGLAQVTQGYVGCDVPGYARKLEINRHYVAHYSLRQDLAVLLRTLLWMVAGRGWHWRAGGEAELVPVEPGLRGALRELLGRLRASHVPFAVLRGVEALEDPERVGDVDLLLEPADVRRFEQHLQVACRRAGARLFEQHHAGFLHQYHLHARDAAGRTRFLALDVHTSEACYGVPFLTAEELLGLLEDPDVDGLAPRLASSASVLVDFLGPYLSAGTLHPFYTERLRRGLHAERAAVLLLAARIFGRRPATNLVDALERGADVEVRRHVRHLRRCLWLRGLARRPLTTVTGFAGFLYGTRLRPLWRPRGRVVAFLGTDGSGKSTLAAAVFERLRSAFRSDRSTIVHLRPGTLPQLNALLHFGKTSYGLEDMARPHRARPSGRLMSNVRLAYYTLDYWVGHLLRILPRRRRHSLVVFDRYYYDYLVDPLRSRIRRGTWLARALARVVPRPRHVFVCSAAPETVLERKQELPPEEVAFQVDAFERVGRERGFHVVRTEAPLEECVEEVLREMFPAA